jgi:hypothetical protein
MSINVLGPSQMTSCMRYSTWGLLWRDGSCGIKRSAGPPQVVLHSSFNISTHFIQRSSFSITTNISILIKMLFQSLAALAMAASSSAKVLEVLAYSTGASGLDLGGASTSQENGVIYRIDNGPWEEISNEKDNSYCASSCSGDDYSAPYHVPKLQDNSFTICVDGDDCVPGTHFTCQFKYGDLVAAYSSTSDSEFWGLGSQEASYCGGQFIGVDL